MVDCLPPLKLEAKAREAGRFPPELVSEVMAHVCEEADGRTLGAMSLGCRLWRTISRPYVFNRVVESSRESLEQLAAFLRSNRDTVPHIRVLVVHPGAEQLFHAMGWVADVPQTLAPLLTDLRVLELVEIHQHHAYLGTRFAADLTGFRTVESFVLTSCSVNPPLLHAILVALPAVRRVALDSWLSIGSDPVSPQPPVSGPRLEELNIRLACTYLDGTGGILPWLAMTETTESIRTFRVTVRSYDAPGVGRFIQAIGTHLEHLELELQVFLGLPLEKSSMKKGISIANCQRLRSFAIQDSDVLSEAVLGFVNELNSPYLETISLTFASDAWVPEALPDLSPLDASLSRSSLWDVKAIEIRYRGPLDTAVAESAIQAALPAVHARGILVVVRA